MADNRNPDVAVWLERLGLGQYVRSFIDRGITFDALCALTAEDLKGLGVAPGHRRQLVAEIGQARKAADPDATPSLSAAQAEEAERRQVTVMFCDLVGSTELSSRLDPEDLRDVVHLYQQTSGDVISHYGGFIAQYLGDGIVAYFGFPRAYEDSAERAVRAGLDIVGALSRLTAPSGAGLQVRIGVATGLAVIGDVLGHGVAQQTAVTGQVPNLAARVESFAQPGTVVVADSTKRLVDRRFACDDLGLQRFKGIDRDVRVWRVACERDEPSQPQNAGLPSSYLVGREKEFAHLRSAWERARKGDGQVMLVSGEAGIGKSALVRQLEAYAGEDAVRVGLYCSARHSDSPLHPVIAHLKRAAGFEPSNSPAAKLGKLEGMLSKDLETNLPLMAALLSVPLQPPYKRTPMPAERSKALTLSLVAKQLVALAADRPVLMIVEDAQWMDPTTEELALKLVDELRDKKVFTLVAARPEYKPAWLDRPHVSAMSLCPLEKDAAEQLVSRVARGIQLPPELLQTILLKADGVPLFVEELTKAVLESGALRKVDEGYVVNKGSLSLSVPSTLQDSLMARLDRLGSAKTVAQIGAVIGRRFSFAMIATITGQLDVSLREAVERLLAAELISRRGQGDGEEFMFKHALVQDAAYDSLLRERKKTLHARIAEEIEARAPDLVQTEPEVLADHWTRGGNSSKAIRYWLKAGQRAISRSGNLEALRHLANGVRELAHMPDDPERGIIEFNLHLALGQAAYVVRGPAAAETVNAYSRAQQLVEEVSDQEQRYALLYGIYSGYHFASKFDLAIEPAKRVLALATQDGDPKHMCLAHRMLGYIAFFRAQTAEASHHFSEISRLYDRETHGPLAFQFGADTRVAALGFQVVIDGVSGAVQRAMETSAAIIADSKRLGHPATLGWAFTSAAYLFFYLRDHAAAARVAQEGYDYCAQNNVGVWAAHCRAFNVWARAHLVDAPGSVEQMGHAIDDAAARIALGLPLLRCAMAEVLMRAGRPQDAVKQTDIALDEIATTGQTFFESAAHQIRGECLLRLRNSADDEIAACFHKARSSALRMAAKLLELRAVMSIARLGADYCNVAAARNDIAALYRSFGQIANCCDFQEARRFLGPENATAC